MLLDLISFCCLLALSKADLKCQNKIDMVIALDSSASVSEDEFRDSKRLAKELVKHFDISKDKTNVAVMSYSQYVQTTRTFSNDASSESVLKAIDGLTYEGSFTRLDLVLETVRFGVFDEATRARTSNTGVKKVVVFITDGFSSLGDEFTKDGTDALKRKGIELFSASISDRIDKAELDVMVNKPVNDHQLIVNSKTPLTSRQVKKLAKTICG